MYRTKNLIELDPYYQQQPAPLPGNLPGSQGGYRPVIPIPTPGRIEIPNFPGGRIHIDPFGNVWPVPGDTTNPEDPGTQVQPPSDTETREPTPGLLGPVIDFAKDSGWKLFFFTLLMIGLIALVWPVVQKEVVPVAKDAAKAALA